MTLSPTQTLRAYAELTKPRILLLVIFTGLPVMAMANDGWLDPVDPPTPVWYPFCSFSP